MCIRDSIRPNNNILYTEQIAFNTPYEITPANPTALYAGGQRIYINENNGNPNGWRPLHEFVLDANATTLALAISPKDPTLIFASTSPLNNKTVPKLFKSTNGGITWQHLSNFCLLYTSGLLVKKVFPEFFLCCIS